MNNFPYKIYCDMDGVLVDFEKGIINAINQELSSDNPKFPKLAATIINELGRNYVKLIDINKNSPQNSRAVRNYMYRLVENDEDFWANLPWTPGGKRLWAHIRQFNPEILTAPMDKGGKLGSLVGKLRWVEKNLGINPEKVNFEHEKWKYAIADDGKPNILIDDFESKINPWKDAGGIGILHLNDKSTIKILKFIKLIQNTA